MPAGSLSWLIVFILIYWAYCFFWGIRAMRRAPTAEAYFLADRNISPWVYALAVTAVTLAGWTFMGFPGLVFRDGFQFLNTAFYGIAVGLGGVLLHKRQWLLGKRHGYMTSGEMFSDYFQGHGLSIATVGISLLFGIPFVALMFGASGFLVSELTDQQISRNEAMWYLSGMVLLYCITGGLQAVAKIAVVQCVLFLFGVVVLGLFALETVGGFDTLNRGLASIAQNLSGYWGYTNGSGGGSFPGFFALPGVIQWTAGLGVESPDGGPWTAIMCLTFMLSVMGIPSSPVLTLWAFASKSTRGFAIHQVWGAAFSVGLVMVVFAAILGVSAHLLGASAEVNDADMTVAQLLPPLGDQEHSKIVPTFIRLISTNNLWLLGVLAVCVIAALQATAAAFMSATGAILTRDIYVRYLQPGADDRTQKLVGRVTTALVFLAAMLIGTYSLNASILLGSLAIAISFQLWPSLLAVTRFPWITRNGAMLGFVAGVIAVVLTEPLGARLTNGALPWGRWPWTIHSGAWGMFFNVVVCLAVSAAGSKDVDWHRRMKFHLFLDRTAAIKKPQRWLKPVAGVIVLVWLFFAIGPGAVIGNILFGEPNAGYDAWNFGMPSIWAWQIIWWALGVGMVWYLANRMEQSTAPDLLGSELDEDDALHTHNQQRLRLGITDHDAKTNQSVTRQVIHEHRPNV